MAAFTRRRGRPPGLAIVLVGHNPASEVYVRNKLKAGSDAGFRADLERLPDTATIDDVLALVERLNMSAAHDGILVQSPLPKALGPDAAARVFDAIDPSKDIDGFTPVNVGRLVQGRATLVPCTPLGIMELLTREGIAIAGRRACVIGRSDIVGKPMALLLLQRDATVTVCHSKTPDLAAVCREADILVAAVGRAGLVTREFVKPGATVIDVGMNTLTDPGVAARVVSRRPSAPGAFPIARIAARRRRASRSGGGGRCADARARRGWPADHRDAHDQHAARRRSARRGRQLKACGALA